MDSLAILLVDDERAVLEMMQLGLQLAVPQHTVCIANDGSEASRLLRTQKFDVVVTDLIMPERDGLELIREIRRTYPAIRVIATSGGGRLHGQQYLQMARGMGAHGLLAKPFQPGDLCEIIDHVVHLNPHD